MSSNFRSQNIGDDPIPRLGKENLALVDDGNLVTVGHTVQKIILITENGLLKFILRRRPTDSGTRLLKLIARLLFAINLDSIVIAGTAKTRPPVDLTGFRLRFVVCITPRIDNE